MLLLWASRSLSSLLSWLHHQPLHPPSTTMISKKHKNPHITPISNLSQLLSAIRLTSNFGPWEIQSSLKSPASSPIGLSLAPVIQQTTRHTLNIPYSFPQLRMPSSTTISYLLFTLDNSYLHLKIPTQVSSRKPSLSSLESKAFPIIYAASIITSYLFREQQLLVSTYILPLPPQGAC